MIFKHFVWVLLLFRLACLSDQRQTSDQGKIPVARVRDYYLYQQDLISIIPPSANEKDSLEIVEKYIQGWVIHHLLASKAEKEINACHAAEIEKKVHEYKCALLTHAYLEAYIEKKAAHDLLPLDQEIEAYYQANKENFKVKQPIIKGKFIILPKHTPYNQHLKQLMISDNPADLENLNSYCAKYAVDFLIDEDKWIKWDDLVTKTPFASIPNKAKLFKITPFTQIQGAKYNYYLRIKTYKRAKDNMPLDLVRKQIAEIVHYKKKNSLVNQIKEDILKQAQQEHAYTIYK